MDFPKTHFSDAAKELVRTWGFKIETGEPGKWNEQGKVRLLLVPAKHFGALPSCARLFDKYGKHKIVQESMFPIEGLFLCSGLKSYGQGALDTTLVNLQNGITKNASRLMRHPNNGQILITPSNMNNSEFECLESTSPLELSAQYSHLSNNPGWDAWKNIRCLKNDQGKEITFPRSGDMLEKIHFMDHFFFHHTMRHGFLKAYRPWMIEATLAQMDQASREEQKEKPHYALPDQAEELVKDLCVYHLALGGNAQAISNFKTLDHFARHVRTELQAIDKKQPRVKANRPGTPPKARKDLPFLIDGT